MTKKDSDNKWFHKSVVYHIYPRSFKDSNNDGVGDLEGIINKLDYLNDGTSQSLGVTAIWLSPIYKSPMADFGYDVSDYYDIDPLFGDLKVFDQLVKEAHKRGIKVMMDLLINHTSSEHSWFKESRSSKDNPKRDWYIWQDPKEDGSPPNNWRSVFGGPAWTLDKKTGQYYLHSFLSEQPDLNWRNEEVKKAMREVIEFWLKKGVDGFRVDALDHLAEDEEFKNDPYNPDYIPFTQSPYSAIEHTHSKSPRDVKTAINTLCDIADSHGDKFIVSEAYIGIPQMVEMYSACRQGVYAPFNFNLMQKPWIASEFRRFIDEFESSLSANDWPNYVFGNHDKSRLATRMGQEKIRIVAMLLMTLRGMPFIYYGDEIGMTDVEIKPEEIQDPYAKRTGNLRFSRDPERSPMQWDDSSYAGFSETKPWLPLSKDYKNKNVKSQSEDKKSLLNLYKNLIHYRNSSEPLMYGKYESLDTKSPDILSFVREHGGKKNLIMLNFSSKSIREILPCPEAKIVLNSYLDKKDETLLKEVEFRPNEGFLFEID